MEKHEVFSGYHNSIVGNHGVGRTLNILCHWEVMRGLGFGCRNVSEWINFQRLPEWDEVEHHLYMLSLLTSLSADTQGPLKEDENGNSFVIVIVDKFLKLIGLYPAKKTTSKEFIHALLQWV